MIFIGIAGPSAAGKTTLANYLETTYKDEFEHIRQDDYQKHPDEYPQKDGLKNWMHPDNIKFDILYDHLKRLQMEQRVLTKTFAWREGEQVHEYYLDPKKYVLVEGVFVLLNEDVSAMLDPKIYIDVPVEVTLSRRLERSGHEFDLSEYDKKITIPEYNRHGLIQKTQADYIIDGTKAPIEVAHEVKQIIQKHNAKK